MRFKNGVRGKNRVCFVVFFGFYETAKKLLVSLLFFRERLKNGFNFLEAIFDTLGGLVKGVFEVIEIIVFDVGCF